MSSVSSLLNRISRLKNVYESFQIKDEKSFNIFHLCGVDHYETMHSKIIAEFLNPNASHGLGLKFLKHFMELPSVRDSLCQLKDFPMGDDNDWALAQVNTEESYEDGRERLDIAIHWQGWCFVIENKIFAMDQPRQLERYADDIERDGEKPIIFYLTLDGHEASENSAGCVSYGCLSYRNDIADWIEECAHDAFDRPYIRESLNQYRNLILELSNGKKESKMNNVVVKEIVATTEDFISASAIGKAMQNARAEVAKKIMGDLQSIMARDPVFEGWHLNHENLYRFVDDIGARHKYWHGFSVEGHSKYKKYFSMACEFQIQGELRELFIGFTRKSADKEASLRFLKAARQAQMLKKHNYDFYRDEGTGWLYGKFPDGSDKDLRFAASDPDAFLAGLLDNTTRQLFASKLAAYLSGMLIDATGIADQLDGNDSKIEH